MSANLIDNIGRGVAGGGRSPLSSMSPSKSAVAVDDEEAKGNVAVRARASVVKIDVDEKVVHLFGMFFLMTFSVCGKDVGMGVGVGVGVGWGGVGWGWEWG